MKNGYVHIYTGNGKGKTTAAFGLAVRALCAGKKVLIIQFVKGMKYSELKLVDFFDKLIIKQFGKNCFIKNNPEKEDIDLAVQGFKFFKELINKNEFDVIILDELNIALYYNLLNEKDVISVLNHRSCDSEIIITGRYASETFIEFADLVTEMREVKHYYQDGVSARIGIEK